MEEAAKLTPSFYDAQAYGIKLEQLDERALEVLETLNDAGFEAYLVGGCVRDLLLGLMPKDFDIATNARPEQVKGLFRNCRLIGRRFRLAHIYFYRDVIEVATFRAPAQEEVVSHRYGNVLEDNHYGTIEEDVIRRDFTINALYYDARTQQIIDYLGAMEDIKAGRIALIGQAQQRYTEDPVRMLRAARFAAKLSMALEGEAERAIKEKRELLKAVPSARLFDEVQKLFLGGYGLRCFESLQRYDLFAMLFPDTQTSFAHPNVDFARYSQQMVETALRNTDERIGNGQSVTVAFLLAAILWPIYQLQYQGLLKERGNWHSAMYEAIDLVLIAASERVAIPMRFKTMIRDIWALQARLQLLFERYAQQGRRFKKSMFNDEKMINVLQHRRFRAAYDFLLVRQSAGEPVEAWAEFWQRVQEDSQAVALIAQAAALQDTRRPYQRHRRRR